MKRTPPAAEETPARLGVLIGAALFSTAGAAIKACSMTGWQTACLRSVVAGLTVFLLMPETRRGWKLKVVPVAAVYAATLILFVLANKLTTSASTIFIQNASPLYVIVFGWILLRERLRRSDIGFIAILGAGMALFFIDLPAPAATAPDPGLGNILAVGSGLTMAGTLVGLRWLARDKHQDGQAGAAVVMGELRARRDLTEHEYFRAGACVYPMLYTSNLRCRCDADWAQMRYGRDLRDRRPIWMGLGGERHVVSCAPRARSRRGERPTLDHVDSPHGAPSSSWMRAVPWPGWFCLRKVDSPKREGWGDCKKRD